MNAQDRDRSLDRLLRQPSAYGDRTARDGCPDAETMAAWMDGGLDADAAALAESHIADCARCQAVVATMIRTEPAALSEGRSAVAASVPWWKFNLRWLIPATAGVTAALLWTLVPDQQRAASIAERQFAPAAESVEAPPAPAPLGSAPEPGRVDQEAPQAARQDEARFAPLEGTRLEEAATAEPPAARPRAAPPPAPAAEMAVPRSRPPAAPDSAAFKAESGPVRAGQAARDRSEPAAAMAAGFAAPVEIHSPDQAIRWRLTGSAVQRTSDGGQSWTAVEVENAEDLVAGSAPSTTVCWLVGRNGRVMLTTDAGAWRQVSMPSPDDLVGVDADDEANAVVGTADGRRFRTVDGGATWAPVDAGSTADALGGPRWR